MSTSTNTTPATSDNPADRRQHDRFALLAPYTPVSVRLAGESIFASEGHAYDVSEGGLRFELDDAIEPGTDIEVKLDVFDRPSLPGQQIEPITIIARGTVVWNDDDDAAGPVRMAAVFRTFESVAHHDRLKTMLGAGRLKLAA
ncbi:MAG: PilZ domain-containing protein [Planctomycetota bacterium]